MAYLDEINRKVQREVKNHLINSITNGVDGHFDKDTFYEAVHAAKAVHILSDGALDLLRLNIMDLYENECNYARIFSAIGKLLSYEEINDVIGNELVHIDIHKIKWESNNYNEDEDEDEYI